MSRAQAGPHQQNTVQPQHSWASRAGIAIVTGPTNYPAIIRQRQSNKSQFNPQNLSKTTPQQTGPKKGTLTAEL